MKLLKLRPSKIEDEFEDERHPACFFQNFVSCFVDIDRPRSTYQRRQTRRRNPMQYLLMIYSNESDWDKASEAERAKVFEEYMGFTKEIIDSGHYVNGNQLHATSKATTVRVRDKKRLVTDGPFAETKEQI